MRFQYLSFPSSLHSFLHAPSFGFNIQTSASRLSNFLRSLILVSMSNFPLSHLPLSHQFSAVTWLQYLHVPPFLSTPSCPCVSQHFFACIFMYLHFLSMSRLHPSSLNNFLRSSCFNIELSLSPMCPSISCIHFASYVGFPQWPLHHFLRFYCFNTGTSPASTTSCIHLVSVSKFPAPRARSKKTCTGSKKEGAKAQKHPAQCESL